MSGSAEVAAHRGPGPADEAAAARPVRYRAPTAISDAAPASHTHMAVITAITTATATAVNTTGVAAAARCRVYRAIAAPMAARIRNTRPASPGSRITRSNGIWIMSRRRWCRSWMNFARSSSTAMALSRFPSASADRFHRS